MATTSKYTIQVDTKGASQASQKLGGVSNSLSSMAEQAVIAGAAYFSAQGIINGMKRAIELAQEQARVERVLQSTIGGSIAKWKEFAGAVQRATNHGDEVILQQIAIAKQMRLSDAETKRLIVASLNLADAMGRDVQGVMMQLAKTYSGQRGEMGELVPAIREMSSEQLQHGEAVKFVLEQYKGLSEAAADGIKQQQNAWGDLMELIGEELTPAWEFFGTTALGSAEALAQSTKETYTFTAGQRIALMALGAFNKLIGENKESLESLTEATEEYTAANNEFVGPLQQAAAQPDRPTWLPDVDDFEDELAEILELEREMREEARAAEQAAKDQQFQDDLNAEIDRMTAQIQLLDEQKSKEFAIKKAAKDANKRLLGMQAADDAAYLMKATGNAKAAAVLEAASATYKAWGASQNTLKKASEVFLPPVPQIMAGVTLAAGLANAAQIMSAAKFAKGGDFMTSGPQLIMVGDNPGGRERVQITPTSSPNLEGPRTAGVTINLQAGIVEQGTVADLADRLAHRLRRNLA